MRSNPIDIARTQLGVREATGANDGVPSERYMFGRKVPWCAYFVVWCCNGAKRYIKGNRWKLGSVSYLQKCVEPVQFQHVRSGDIVFFSDRGRSDAGVGRHCGLVEKVTKTHLHTIEGNTGNAVRRRRYRLNNSRISGYGRPKSNGQTGHQDDRVLAGNNSGTAADSATSDRPDTKQHSRDDSKRDCGGRVHGR
jgi:hypothetical protein